MRALLFDGTTLKSVKDHPLPQPSHDQVLVRVLRAGICNTDLELTKGYMGFRGVLGHEFVGRAERGALRGQRVVGEINLACGKCPTCLGGNPTQCPQRTTLGIDRHDGAFAEYLSLPGRNLHALPPHVSNDQAVFVEPLAAALQILEFTPVRPSSRVVLIGAGKLGLLCAQVLSLTGCHLNVVARHQRQYDLLRRWRIRSTPFEALSKHQADVVVDCTGTVHGFGHALQLVRPRGIIHLKSTYQGLPQADLTRVVVDEVQVHTSRCGPFAAAIRLLDNKAIEIEPMIDAHFAIEDGVAAFEQAKTRGVLKVVLDVTQGTCGSPNRPCALRTPNLAPRCISLEDSSAAIQ